MVDKASLSVALGSMTVVWSMPSTGRMVRGSKMWQKRWPFRMKNFSVQAPVESEVSRRAIELAMRPGWWGSGMLTGQPAVLGGAPRP